MHLDLRNSWAAMIVAAIGGTFILVCLIALGVGPVALGYRARQFPSCTATVKSFKIVESPGKGGPRYRPQISYSYKVNGASCESSRIGLLEENVSEAEEVKLRSTYFPGAAISVYYDPRDPATALIDRTMRLPLMLTALLSGFAVGVFVVGWIDLIDAIVWRTRRLPGGGVFLKRTGKVLRITMPPMSPLAMAAGAGVLVSIVTTIAVVVWAIVSKVETVSDGMLITTALLGWTPIVPVYVWARWMHKSGEWDVILDQAAHLISLPATFGRDKAFVMLTSRIVDVFDDSEIRVIQTDKGSATVCIHRPTIEWHSDVGRIHKEQVAEWEDGGKAKAFVRWLQAVLIETDRKKLEASGRESLLEGLYTERARER